MCVESLSRVQFFVTSWTVACQAPWSMTFYRKAYWNCLPFSTPGESFWPRDQTHISWVSCIGRQILYHCVTWETGIWSDMREFLIPAFPFTSPWLRRFTLPKLQFPYLQNRDRNIFLREILWEMNCIIHIEYLMQSL